MIMEEERVKKLEAARKLREGEEKKGEMERRDKGGMEEGKEKKKDADVIFSVDHQLEN